ncbi:hypothetical protein Sjap_000822 [Stephania japonica]|uniref:NPH3 domain-containing protein n=1 Tax=Stephania japonica TaxID=461633 RepID=A0AAP0KIU4_9MAGN
MATTRESIRESWFSKSTPSPDTVIHVDGRPFHLIQKLMATKSGKLASLIQQNQNEQPPLSYSLTDIPGDFTTFEQVSRFCSGLGAKLSSNNIVPLICVAHYLEMTDQHSPDNLLNKASSFFQVNVIPHWNECIKALIGTAKDNVFEQALHLGLVEACANSLVAKARLNPQVLGEPLVDQNPTAKRRIFAFDSMESNDLSALPLGLYAPIISTMIQVGVRLEYVAGSIFRYLNKHANLGCIEGEWHDDHQVYEKRFRGDVIETLEKLLPDEAGLIPCQLLSQMLQSAIALQASSNCRHALEIRLGNQLEEAKIEDLLIHSYGYSKELKYDIECVERVLKAFLAKCASSRLNRTSMIKVTELVEEFLVKITNEEELSKDKFIALTKTSEEMLLSNQNYVGLDRIYHAIDIYLDKHRNLTESEREEVCQVLDFYKMSPEACTHASQNKRLPMRVVVHALFVGQLHLREAIINKLEHSEYGGSQEDNEDRVVNDDYSDEARMEMERMDDRVVELEIECSKMKNQITDKCRPKEKFTVWKKLKRKFGCASDSSLEQNCHIEKKRRPGN